MIEENYKHPYIPSKYAKYICGTEPWPENCDIIWKSYGYVLPVNCSAYGDWWPHPDEPENERFFKNNLLKSNSEENRELSDGCMLMQQLSNHCDYHFKKCGDCGKKCTHPSGKCSGSCADCLKEIQYHRSDGRTEYDCKNMLRYYTCHTIWKRCSEIMYALETIDLEKYPRFNILSIGCGASPDLMAFHEMTGDKKMSYLGIDIATKRKDIHDFIMQKANNTKVDFERRDIYEMLEEPSSITRSQNNYNVLALQYMIAGHIYSDRAEKISFLFDEIIDKLIAKKPKDSPLLLIINDIDHKSWIRDYFNLFIKKLRRCGLTFQYNKRHFVPREDGDKAGSKLYRSRANKFTTNISAEHREKYNAHAPCSAAQLIIEVT